MLYGNHPPIQAKSKFKGLVGHLKWDLVDEDLMEDLKGRPWGEVDTPKIKSLEFQGLPLLDGLHFYPELKSLENLDT